MIEKLANARRLKLTLLYGGRSLIPEARAKIRRKLPLADSLKRYVTATSASAVAVIRLVARAEAPLT